MKALHPLHWRTLAAHQEAAEGRWARGAALLLTLLAFCAAGLVVGIFLAHVMP